MISKEQAVEAVANAQQSLDKVGRLMVDAKVKVAEREFAVAALLVQEAMHTVMRLHLGLAHLGLFQTEVRALLEESE